MSLLVLLRRIWRRLCRQAETAPVVPAAPPPVLLLPAPVAARPAREVKVVRNAGQDGQFYFRETILDQLKHYMLYVARMRRGDREAYNLYSRVGANIWPVACNDFIWDNTELSPWFRERLPTFGAIAYVSPAVERREDREKFLYPRFMYFNKYKRPPSTIEVPNSGTVYAVTAYFDKANAPKLKHGAPMEFPVVVDEAGGVRVLRTRLTDVQRIRHRGTEHRMTWRGRVKTRPMASSSTVTHQRWGIAETYIQWAAEHKIDAQTLLRRLFIGTANAFVASSSSMIRVAASRGGLAATFGVDVTRTPYFFADREPVIGPDGKKQRIFHIVRTHSRVKDGQRSAVRTHFRGVRRFKWNGYDIHISVPGRDHADIAEWSAGTESEEWAVPGKEYLDSAGVGAFIADHIDTGWKRPTVH